MATRPKPIGKDSRGPIFAYDDKGRAVCGAKLAGKSAICKSTVRMANGRCHKHGGANLPGRIKPDAKPESIRRRNRTELYKRLQILDKATIAREDPDLRSHVENIAAIEGLIAALAEGPFTPTGELWVQARDLYDRGVKRKDAAALVELGKVLRSGLSANAVIDRLVSLMESQRRHIDSEAKREAQLQVTMTSAQAQFLVAQLFEIVKQHVPDEQIRVAIGRKLVELLGEGPSRTSD